MSKTRMGKRVASLLLSLVMMLSLLPTTVYAEGADTGDTTDEIVGQATTSGDNTEGTGEPEPTGEGEDGSANVTEGEDGAATNDAVVEETIAPVNAEGVDAVANAESSGDEVSGADVNELVNFVTVNGDATMYKTLDAAIEAAEPVNGVITYTINGKVEVTDTGWVQVAKAGLTGLTKVAFVGATDNAEICITNGVAILADETYDIDVSFEKLKLRKLNPQWTNDYGHCTNYFTTWLRNTGAAENTVTYTDCTFPNGVCNNQYGKTVFDNCQFINATEGLYNLWVYGGNVELNGGKFSGTRGAKVYTEGTPETVPAVTIKDTSFDGLTEKAAIVVSKAATVTLTDVSANNCSVGLFQKDIEKSGETTTITANGEKISGEFNITAEKGTATAKNEFNISAGTFTSEVPNDYCADGFEVKANADGTTYGVVEAATAAAQIGETTYETLAEAFAAAKDGDTITLLRDCSGDGIGVKPGTFTSKGLTVDFAGHAYTVGGKLVGSSGTMSNGFQLNKNNKITFQNGAIYGDASVAGDDTTSWSGAPAILIQNYCDLTLSGMKVSGGSNTVYTMSNNCGNVVIENTTINAGRGSSNRAPFALDACGYSDYTGVSVTVKGTSAINGDIEVSRSAKNKNAVTLTLESGTVNGKLKIDSSIKSGDATTVTKSNAVNVAAPAGYVWDNGTLAAAVAQIGETGYASLQAAIDAVKSGGTIKLLQNVDLGTDNYLSADSTAKNVTIDLGNHAVTSAYKNFTLYLKVTNWTIQNGTIKNTNTGAYGTLAVTTRSSSATLKGLTVESATNGVYVKIASGFDNIVASITVEDGTKISGDQYGVYMEGQPKPYNKIRNGQEILNVNGGEITGKTAAIAVFGAGADNTKAGVTVNINGGKVYSEGFAIAGDGATLRENTTINISGGEVISTKDTAIYHPQAGTVTISGGEVYGVTGGVQMCAGTLNVTGGTISATGNGDVSGKTGDGSIPDGAAVSIVNRAYPAGAPTMTISGGTFTSAAGVGAVQAYGWKNNSQQTWDKPNASVSGGKFTSAVPENYCAEGFIPTENTDGTYGVKEGKYVAKVGSKKYETLADAIGAAQDGDTVTLLKDIDLPATAVVKRKTITLDLNGKTISNSTDIWNESINAWSLISVRDNGDLTINDTAGGGTLKAKENDCYALDVQDKDTALTVNAGTYVGNISAIYAYDGKVTINGGHFSIQQKKDDGDPYRFTLNCYDSNYKADSAGFTVNGGTFENFDPRNNPAEGAGTSFVAESVGVDKNTDGTFTAKPNMAAQIVDAGGGSVAAYAGHYDAIAAAKDGETVILLSDRKNFVTNTINANITIDLNGKTLSVGNNNPFFCTNGEVTIQNGTIESNYACAIVNAYNKLTLKNVKITGVTGDSGKNLVNVCSNAEVTIDKDTVLTASGSGVAVFIGQNADAKYTLNVYGKVIQQNKSYAISGNGSYEGATTINIYEGAEVRSASVAIYHPQAGEINVYGGLVEGYCGIGIKSGTLNITGGQVLGVHDDDELSDENSNPNGMTYDGSAIIIDSRAAYAGNVKINISGDALVQSSYSTAIREIGESAETTNVTALNVTGGKVLGASGKAAIQLHGVTADVTSISGGTFSSKVPPEYCAPGYVPTGEDADGRFTVKEGEFTVQVTSRTVSSNSPVANVSGGGSNITYAVGTTVTAASLSGYKFVGWFVNEYTDKSKAVNPNLSFTYKPTADCTLIAVYEPISGAKFYLTVNASEFTVGESAVYDSYMHDQVAAGESVTVTFKGTENFLYWVNASRKVVSTNPAYTFIMGSKTTLSAVYGKTREAQATVVFMSDSDQIITSKAYKSGTAIQFPTPPIKMGCTFEAWSMTEKEIQDAIAASNNGVIVVKACYTDPSTPYTVTVLYPDDTKEEYSGMVGKTVTLTAKKISGKTFSYWRDSKNNVLGYTTTLMLAPSGNITVTAVYGDTAEVKPVITMTAVEAGKAETSYYVISFRATRAVPEGYTVVKQGILYSVDSQCTGEGAKDYMKLTDEGSVPAGIYEFEGNNTELSGVTLLHAKVGAVDRTIYGRGYMVLKNSSGTMEYVYSDNILSGSYSGLTKIGG